MCVHVNKIDLVPYPHIMLLTLQPPATSVSILMTKKKEKPGFTFFTYFLFSLLKPKQ